MFKSDNREKLKKIGVGFATGRSNFIKILKYQYENWKRSGILDDPNIRLHIFIAYDIQYDNLDERAFLKLPKELKKGLKNITFIGEKQVKAICKRLQKERSISTDDTKDIFGSHGYGKLRNSILYTAMKEDIDYLLFLDDDEYPVVPLKNDNGKLEWIQQKILYTHLQYIEDCDVTFGHHCGYISPIPHFNLGIDISEECFKDFIEVISNDIINLEKMKNLNVINKGITYGDEELLSNKKVEEIKFLNGGKWIAGTNLCLNLKRMKKAYPFYNPPNGRGEDTFFSTCLKTEKVLKIPVYSFHDGFLKCTSITKGIFPKKLEPAEATNPEVKERFFRACIGWIKYKPLLIYVTNKRNYIEKISDINKKLDKCLPEICDFFETEKFYQMKESLETYNQEVEKHYNMFETVKNTWRNIYTDKEMIEYKDRQKYIRICKEIFSSLLLSAKSQAAVTAITAILLITTAIVAPSIVTNNYKLKNNAKEKVDMLEESEKHIASDSESNIYESEKPSMDNKDEKSSIDNEDEKPSIDNEGEESLIKNEDEKPLIENKNEKNNDITTEEFIGDSGETNTTVKSDYETAISQEEKNMTDTINDITKEETSYSEYYIFSIDNYDGGVTEEEWRYNFSTKLYYSSYDVTKKYGVTKEMDDGITINNFKNTVYPKLLQEIEKTTQIKIDNYDGELPTEYLEGLNQEKQKMIEQLDQLYDLSN